MSEKPAEFWHLDLTKLTLSGWLLILFAIGTTIGVSLVTINLMVDSSEGRSDGGKNPVPRWKGAIGVGLGIGGGAIVFDLGRRLLKRIGLSIMRRKKE